MRHRKYASREGGGNLSEQFRRPTCATLSFLDGCAQIRENYGREGADRIHLIAGQLGLYSKPYGKGRHTVLVVSKQPLPNFRPDLDSRREERQASTTCLRNSPPPPPHPL